MKIEVIILGQFNDNLYNALIKFYRYITDENGNASYEVVTQIGTAISGDFVVGKTYIAELQEQAQRENS
ncbi:MAG: hypothetical protein QXT77_07190 [Candidatus Methanomethylicaceae archaeon]